ncbi:glycoside hydrolase family 88 protein [Reichenbachiella agarivorans]|uniref:Glycoside hydrolase family 88 protein n=1 Tax=Reichenbachiella agarivorans TaxID=2979464 RepID=A0ABY6CRH1_9BACT|nr:glycoside hydrolase family 88 protein [Reichenbachiella agarivorans]UXP32635.1 glycoside hydrolase family 88 protein [Reichenbachiella agarivorans]
MKNHILTIVLVGLIGMGCQQKQKEAFDIDKQLDYCVSQAQKTLQLIPDDSASIPRNIPNGAKDWTYVEYRDWTSGFWPGTLWYLYEYTGAQNLKEEANQFTQYLKPLSVEPATDHDLGFQVFCSAGNGYRLTNNPAYKEMILKSSDTLATLYNPVVGTILSWPVKTEYPHNTIIDNMINLEMLYWAAENDGTPALKEIAVTHADKTMNNHFRDDFSAYHVVIYDTITGEKIKGITHQGYADETMWARGQGWAIYGYTMMYRETKKPAYLKMAQNTARIYLDRLPSDMIPYWDFDAPGIPDAPRDASAAAIVASALLELSLYSEEALSNEYVSKATAMLEELSNNYQSRNKNTAFLMHSTGHHPNGSEIDASIIYADYYYVEALLRLKKLQQGEPIVNSVLASFLPKSNKS